MSVGRESVLTSPALPRALVIQSGCFNVRLGDLIVSTSEVPATMPAELWLEHYCKIKTGVAQNQLCSS